MHTITIIEDRTIPADAPVSVTRNGNDVSVVMGRGNHVVLQRKGNQSKRRPVLKAILARMDKMQYDPTKQTGADILREMRDRHG